MKFKPGDVVRLREEIALSFERRPHLLALRRVDGRLDYETRTQVLDLETGETVERRGQWLRKEAWFQT